MSHEIPRSVQDAASVLLRACLEAARTDRAVAASLRSLTKYLSEELSALDGHGGREPRPERGAAGSGGSSDAHTVLTPPGRPRDFAEASGGSSEDKEKSSGRIAEPLAIVVTRARWKASACRLALKRRDDRSAPEGEREALEAQAASREKSLRGRLSALPDTSAWMLDFPFGKRVTESDAFDVDAVTAKKLENIADCYETVATGAEIAMELDESGVFRGGPPAAFLYLLAESQSALLHSLNEAPTRTDSDQRDVFLWLKDQTTRYRIYVDRHMRLDDPADVAGSAGLQERLRRSAREAVEERTARRERGQHLSKIRYHVGKVVTDGSPLHSEVDSLRQAIERWKDAGHAVNERSLVEALRPLRKHAAELADSETKDDVFELLSASGLAPVLTPSQDGTRDHVVTPAAGGGVSQDPASAATPQESDKSAALLSEVRQLLGGRRITLCCEPSAYVSVDSLREALGPGELRRVDVELDGPDHWSTLDALIRDEATDLVLLGIRLPSDEYQRFKEGCLAQQKPFVRLPGPFNAPVIAHQISRQVGWRLRGQAKGVESNESGPQ